MKNLPTFLLLVFIAFALIACNKEKRQIKRLTKSMEGSRLWDGDNWSSMPVIDSNGQRQGYTSQKRTIKDTLLKIKVVDNNTIRFFGDLDYYASGSTADKVIYQGIKNYLIYYVQKDSISYSYTNGLTATYGWNLHTK